MDQDQELPFIYEVFSPKLPRLAPGDGEATRVALALAKYLSPGIRDACSSASLRIIDLGCGNGAQTLQLVKETGAHTVAIDNYQPYLNEVIRRARAEAVGSQIEPCCEDMRRAADRGQQFDLVWSEGALYNIGFGQGIELCRDLVSPRGLAVVSELSWLREDAPAECRSFWADEYPGMKTVASNLQLIRESGCEALGHFVLNSRAWWNDFYDPLAERVRALRVQYRTDPERNEFLNSIDTEIAMFKSYSRFFGYVFLLFRRGAP